jgi:hypothetical protein
LFSVSIICPSPVDITSTKCLSCHSFIEGSIRHYIRGSNLTFFPQHFPGYHDIQTIQTLTPHDILFHQ